MYALARLLKVMNKWSAKVLNIILYTLSKIDSHLLLLSYPFGVWYLAQNWRNQICSLKYHLFSFHVYICVYNIHVYIMNIIYVYMYIYIYTYIYIERERERAAHGKLVPGFLLDLKIHWCSSPLCHLFSCNIHYFFI
jgi:hypothetical protein